MKPFTKGLWLGVAIGGGAAVALALGATIAFSVFMRSPMGREFIAQAVLQPLSFPAANEIVALGALDPEWTLQTLDGDAVRLGSFHGKPVFLNVWATWCFPCLMEMPGIAKLQESLGEGAVTFILASGEDAEVVRRFVKAEDLDLPVYLLTGTVPDLLDSGALPLTLILDSEGQVVFRHTGAARWDDDRCRAFLASLAP